MIERQENLSTCKIYHCNVLVDKSILKIFVGLSDGNFFVEFRVQINEVGLDYTDQPHL